MDPIPAKEMNLPVAPSHAGLSPNASRMVYLGCGALAVGIFAFDLSIELGVAAGVLHILVVLAAMWLPERKAIFAVAVICSMLTVVAFLVKPPVLEMWKAIFNRVLTLMVIWAAAVLGFQRKLSEFRRDEAVREREKVMNDLRILRGLLPICASCKKIRDDEGYWIQIEQFIHEHSEADFTHGICPDCATKLFPSLRPPRGSSTST